MAEPVLPRVAGGDPAAVRECIARYGPLVWGLARRLAPRPADAEDAAQEVFIALWQSAGRYDPAQAAEATFVAMIARRRLIDRRRRFLRRPPPDPLPEAVPCRAEADPVERADDAARAAAALAELRDDQRAVIELAVYHGLTHEEIAARTGLPLGTVKTHIRRGLIRVRERLDAAPVEGGGR